jgi:hypothetical protein
MLGDSSVLILFTDGVGLQASPDITCGLAMNLGQHPRRTKMRIHRLPSLICQFLLLSIGALVLGTEDDNLTVTALKSAQLQHDAVERIPLNQSKIRIRKKDSDKIEKVPVTLMRITYDCVLLRTVQGKLVQTRRSLTCYELRSTTDDPVFNWAMWSSGPYGEFRLFGDEDGSNYLVWVESLDVFFIRISGARDRLVALTEFLQKEEQVRAELVPVFKLVGREPFEGLNALWSEINVKSFNVDERGKITVRLSGTDPKEIFTLVRENGEWRRE